MMRDERRIFLLQGTRRERQSLIRLKRLAKPKRQMLGAAPHTRVCDLQSQASA
jgi:hypothetical protein